MQWKSIKEDGMPDALVVVFAELCETSRIGMRCQMAECIRPGIYVIHNTATDERPPWTIEFPPHSSHPHNYTHYLILEPPEVE